MTTALEDIPGLVRCETVPRSRALAIAADMTRPSYTHDQVYGDFCTLQGHIAAPIDTVYDYLVDIGNLDEWTYSTRAFRPVGDDGLYVGVDTLADDTRIFMRIDANCDARLVDYHCAWDQGDELWMIYHFRLLDARTVMGRDGTVLIWTNVHHRYYDHNPRPELAPPDRVWVGDMWPLFWAGHELELRNLRAILEHRQAGAVPTADLARSLGAAL